MNADPSASSTTHPRLDPAHFVIKRRRKKYKFALFHNSPLCFEQDAWTNKPRPDVLELGAGTGWFSIALAETALRKHHVAIDRKADRLQTGARWAEEKGLTNLRFLRARIDLLAEYFAPHSVSTIWLTFPDPYAKKRSAKHRLTHPRFLAIYQMILRPGGALYLKTDAKQLFDWSLEQLVSEGWRIEELSFDLHESSEPSAYKVKTTYETRYVQQGLKINFVKALPPRKLLHKV